MGLDFRQFTIALAGNPNVGKSTVFNNLTGMRQHTGNWPGKTVTAASGNCSYKGYDLLLIDLPGTYSLAAHSPEEEVTRDYIRSDQADATIVICDATCLERNLILVMQTLAITTRVIVGVNLLDEAASKGITIDIARLEQMLSVPVVPLVASCGKGCDRLLERTVNAIENTGKDSPPAWATLDAAALVNKAHEINSAVVCCNCAEPNARDRRLDRLLSGRRTALPIMLLLLAAVFWITINGANYPSDWLAALFYKAETLLLSAALKYGIPELIYKPLIDGVFHLLSCVVSVMLPPMAIFFPLFTLLEDSGYLPRVAFNLDKCFQRCHACGKQALTLCMGFGCNAAGVIGCRIIDSPRERLIAILTNNFVPCNGRFPTLIAIISMFFVIGSGFGASIMATLLLTAVIVAGIVMTFIVSSFLSRTLLKGQPSSFILELPPYRRPQFLKVIIRSIYDRTLFVLMRAVVVAAPAGLVIWLFANIYVDGVSILSYIAAFLDPFGKLLGLDGVILLAFILGFPANETVIPLIIMGYTAGGVLSDASSLSQLHNLLVANGWTAVTAICTIIFMLMHWPCSTTCLTIYKETKSLRWTALAFITPTACGLLICFVIATISRLL